MTDKFWRAASIRAIKTICQAAVSMIGTTAMLHEVNWVAVVSSSLLAGLLSILTSLSTGLPEVPPEE